MASRMRATRSRTYEFSGTGLADALDRISRPSASGVEQVKSTPAPPRPAHAAPRLTSGEDLIESRDRALIEKMGAFRLVVFPCSNPRLLQPVTRKGHATLHQHLESSVACGNKASDRELGQLVSFARGHLGAKVERRTATHYSWIIHCSVRCRQTFRRFVDEQLKAISSRQEKRKAFLKLGEKSLAALGRMLEAGGR